MDRIEPDTSQHHCPGGNRLVSADPVRVHKVAEGRAWKVLSMGKVGGEWGLASGHFLRLNPLGLQLFEASQSGVRLVKGAWVGGLSPCTTSMMVSATPTDSDPSDPHGSLVSNERMWIYV